MNHVWAPTPSGDIACLQCGMAYIDRSAVGDDCQPRPQPHQPPQNAQPSSQSPQPGYTTSSTIIPHTFDYDCECVRCKSERIRRANEAIRRNS